MTRWGILSTGRIANQFASDLRFVEDAKLAAVASRSAASAASFATTHSIPQAHSTYEALYADPSVDVIYVATPHSLHEENCIAALKHGKAVLCEKPLTVDAAACQRLLIAHGGTEAYLMEGLWSYFLPAVETAHRWLSEGKIGRLLHFKIDFGYPQLPYDPERREYNASLGGGAMRELGIYLLAFSSLFSDAHPTIESVHAEWAPNGVESDLIAIANYDGVRATLATSFRCKLQNWAYLIGEDGYIAIPDFWRAKTCQRFELDTLVETFTDDSPGVGFHHEARAVMADLAAGRRESPRVPLAASLNWQRQIEMFIASAQGAN